MSATETDVEREAHAAPGEGHAHPSDSLYVKVALVLAALTALEVSTYYVEFGPLFLPVLLILMVVKFIIVVLFFMHLRFDSKLFGRVFWSGLVLAVLVYVAALTSFEFWK